MNNYSYNNVQEWDVFLSSEDPSLTPDSIYSALYYFETYGIYYADFIKYDRFCYFDWDSFYADQSEWIVYYFENEQISTEDWIRFHRADGGFDWDSYNEYYITPTESPILPWSHYEENFNLVEDPDIQWYDDTDGGFDWDGYWASIYKEKKIPHAPKPGLTAKKTPVSKPPAPKTDKPEDEPVNPIDRPVVIGDNDPISSDPEPVFPIDRPVETDDNNPISTDPVFPVTPDIDRPI